MKTGASTALALLALGLSAHASLSGLTAGVNSLRTNFTGNHQWRESGASARVILVIGKKSESGGVIHFSGRDTYLPRAGDTTPVSMDMTGEINRKDRTITIKESNPDHPARADVDGVFKGTISRDLQVIKAVWTHGDEQLGDLSLVAVTLDHPPKGGASPQKNPLVFGDNIAPHSNVGAGDLGSYMTMPQAELLERFTHPGNFRDYDPVITRSNALSALLERKIVARGMNQDAVKKILGAPDRTDDGAWIYEKDIVSDEGVRIFFDPNGLVKGIRWHFGTADGGIPDYSHDY